MKTTTALCALAGVMLAAPGFLSAQTRVDRDVAFVQKLATELRFIALAQTEIEQLQTEYTDSADFKKVTQAGISIALIGARSHPDREQRRTLFKDTLDRASEFISRYDGDPVSDQTRVTYVQAAYEFGQFLLDDMEIARTDAPGRLADIESEASKVFTDAIQACDSVMSGLMDALYDDGGLKKQQLFTMWLYKGMLQREMARAIRADREPLARIAKATLEELVFEAGQETLLGQRAYFEMSKVDEVLGNFQNAYQSYRDTVSTIRSALDRAAELGIPDQTAELMFYLLQEAFDRAAISLFEQGKVNETLALIEEYRGDLRKYGTQGEDDLFEIAHPYYGHPVFLTEARALAETGDADKVGEALTQVQKINDLHPADIIGLRAKNVLEDILSLQSTQVSGALLYEVAKGDYQEREYDVAIQGFKRAYAAMSDSERDQYGLELWETVSRCFGAQKRYLESALAAAEGLSRHGGNPDGDVEGVADLLDQAWSLFRRDIKDKDSVALQPLKDRFLELAGLYGGESSEAKLLWREGNNLYNDSKYLQAAQQFAKVPVDTSYYEPAQGRLVRCYQAAGEFDRARNAIQAYQAWTKTPAAELPADRSDALSRRQQTLATMSFFDAYMEYQAATGDTPDQARFPEIISKLETFLAEHRQGGSVYVGRAYDIMARLYAQLGEIDKAEELYRTLRQAEPNSTLVPQLATQIFATHYAMVKSLETEVSAMDEKGQSESPEYARAVAQLETARRATVRSGLDYMANASTASYSVLYNTMSTARDLAFEDPEVWKTVERVGRKLINDFADDAEQGEKVAKYVTPTLGESLLRQRNFREAVPLLRSAAEARPGDYPLKRLLSLAEGGWFELDKRGVPLEVPGLDEPKKAYERHWKEYRKYVLASGVEKYSLEWYEFIFECFCFASRAAAKGDSDLGVIAETLFNTAKTIDNFDTLKNRRGRRGKELFTLFSSVKR